MFSLLLLILAASLFDSFSTMQQILIFIWLLSTKKPFKNSLWFLAGLSGSYLLCGYYGYLGIQKLNTFLHTYFPSMSNFPDSQYYPAQLLTGSLFFIGGIIYYVYQSKSKKPIRPHPLFERLKNINPMLSFFIGGFISISGFPFSLPYLGILEKLSTLGLKHIEALSLIGFYNFIYALPMLVIFGIFLFFHYHIEDIEKKLHLHAVKWNKVVNMLLLSGMGLIMMLDSMSYLLLHHPLFKSKFF